MNRTIKLLDGNHDVSYSFYSICKTDELMGKKIADMAGDNYGFATWMILAGIFNENDKRSVVDVQKLIPLKGLAEVIDTCKAAYFEDLGIEEKKEDGKI